MEDWITQVQENLKCEYEIESMTPPIPPKIIQSLVPPHQSESYSPPTITVMESELLRMCVCVCVCLVLW